ncbi:MFS transporter [Clostridium autoethanogenum]|uniref:DHA2 family efflux MFS transporter permease subunit n=2 Tax=Clostridium autoethanogenum TaxID=84023 RepID=A0A3M0SUK1_9CLOT|nr:MFS transporter [Clostridium autoethanogenum]AGY75402.1 MFS transporter [Clostridium autoethanogenum DSM 10061]ALU35568.1 Multidrug MFS-type transporter [Clostridium autoethanogenum DSM 10061]OVY52370.1 Multidrug resistance protein stp [Clostridium autoethanogenum]RMD02067.1 DHA2 family efflux MFS transporter permease subunit [Clostridium autoethanogenum]
MKKIESEMNKKKWLILITVVSATFMSTLDGSIVNVALPDMASKLNVGMSGITWVVTSFLITVAATILIFGRLGDMIGKTKVFKFGVVLFIMGSLLCGLTSSLPLLVTARVIQAVGASATMATNQGIITHVFPANERGRALGVLGTFVALGSMAGPPIGGIIVSAISWEYIFLINIPIGIIVFILTLKIFPKAHTTSDEKLDIKGALLFVVATVSLFGALGQGQVKGYDNIFIISAFVISFITFVLFIILEHKISMPILQLSIFKNSLFSISIICAFISFIAISASNIILPFYFQDTLKFSPAASGMLMMVSPIVLSVVAPFSGYMSDKIGSEILTLFGLSFTSLGLFFLSSLNERSSVLLIIGYIVIMTLGNGMFQSPNNSLVMSTVSRDKLGIAGSVNALIRNLGFVLGTSLSTLLLYNRMSHKIGYRVVDYIKGRDDVFIYGMRSVYISVGIMCLFGVLITALRLYYSKKLRGLYMKG